MKKVRKPREMKSANNRIFPRIEVYTSKRGRPQIWTQNSPAGKWTQIPPGRALFLAERLERAAKYVEAQ